MDEIEKDVETEVVEQGFRLGVKEVAIPVICSALITLYSFIPAHEGNSLKAYQDVGGVYTICGGVAYVKHEWDAGQAARHQVVARAAQDRAVAASEKIVVSSAAAQEKTAQAALAGQIQALVECQLGQLVSHGEPSNRYV